MENAKANEKPNYIEISALIAREVNSSLMKMRLIHNHDLIMLVEHSLLTGHITTSKAAELLGVSVTTVRELAKSWKLKKID